MRSLSCFGLLAAAVLVGVASSAQAQDYGSYGPPPTVAPPAVSLAPGLPAGPQVVPVLPAPALLPVRPLTVSEFAASFRPLPGRYEVLLIHPKTGCPVKVCFTLKPGCIRTVRVNSHKIDFVYARQCDVVIRFLHSGKVWVRD
jgi:hypothetical protein